MNLMLKVWIQCRVFVLFTIVVYWLFVFFRKILSEEIKKNERG